MKARHLTYLALLALALLLTFGVSTAWADDSSPVDPAVVAAMAQSGGTVPVIVFTDGNMDAVTALLPSSANVAALAPLDAFSADLTDTQIAALAASPDVNSITMDGAVQGTGWQTSSSTMDFTNLAINLDGVQPASQGGPTGAGVNVAVLDSGVTSLSDLTDANGSSRVVAFKDFVRNRRQAYDDAGHGTFVAGLIAGNGASSTPTDQGGKATVQYAGVAPQAGIVALKVLDSQGNGRESDVIRAIAWAIQNRKSYNIRVLNISLGGDVTGPIQTDPLAMAVEAAWKAGIVVVTAAGNEGDFGPGGILSPGNDPYVITVGAMNTQQTADPSDDTVCTYSSIGPTLYDEIAKPDVIAPGNRNISLRVPFSFLDLTAPANRIAVNSYIPDAPSWAPPVYFMLSGTSTATPVVSGIAALMISADPSLTPDDVKARLMATAHQLAGAPMGQQGAGQVDVAAAIASGVTANGYALSQKLGTGTTVLPADTYDRWNNYKWAKYRWTRYRWTRYRWTRYRWTRYRWTDISWTRYRWTTLTQGE
jgi:serine protease AprX